MKLVVIVAVLIFIALVVRYLTDDYGGYSALKPDFVWYTKLFQHFFLNFFFTLLEVGQDVVFINYAYGEVIFESLPEIAKGTMTAISTDADGDIVALAVPGSDGDVRIYSCSSLLMPSRRALPAHMAIKSFPVQNLLF